MYFFFKEKCFHVPHKALSNRVCVIMWARSNTLCSLGTFPVCCSSILYICYTWLRILSSLMCLPLPFFFLVAFQGVPVAQPSTGHGAAGWCHRASDGSAQVWGEGRQGPECLGPACQRHLPGGCSHRQRKPAQEAPHPPRLVDFWISGCRGGPVSSSPDQLGCRGGCALVWRRPQYKMWHGICWN